MATREQVEAFIFMIAPMAQEQYKLGKKILPSVAIAQGCCESAYGTSEKMVRSNAIFGIKVGASKWHFGNAWSGNAYDTKTKECYDGKTYVTINDMFRAYDSIQKSVEDYYDMLCTCNRYKSAVGQTDPKECITAIKNGGYATDPKYVNTIMSIIKSNNLTRFDNVSSVNVTYYPKYNGTTDSIINICNTLGIDSGLSSRSRIAATNGIANYRGTAEQNITLVNLFKSGLCIKPKY